jgi:hypothetical protein
MAKKSGPARYIARHIALRRTLGDPPPIPEEIPDITISTRGMLSAVWSPVLRDAFKAFSLDPSKPLDWKWLIYLLAAAHFQKRSGRRPRWSEEKLCELAAEVAAAKAANPGKSDAAVCKLLAADKGFRRRHGKIGRETLRRLLPQARKLADELSGN